MSLNDILDSLFPAGHTVSVDGQVITGEAQTAQGAITALTRPQKCWPWAPPTNTGRRAIKPVPPCTSFNGPASTS